MQFVDIITYLSNISLEEALAIARLFSNRPVLLSGGETTRSTFVSRAKPAHRCRSNLGKITTG
jgi:ABC-type molybdate transport system ATPase subunit